MTSFKVLAQPLRDVDMGQRGCKVGVGVGAVYGYMLGYGIHRIRRRDCTKARL